MARLKALGEGRSSALGVVTGAQAAVKDHYFCYFRFDPICIVCFAKQDRCTMLHNAWVWGFKVFRAIGLVAESKSTLKESGRCNVSRATSKISSITRSRNNVNRDLSRFLKLPLATRMHI